MRFKKILNEKVKMPKYGWINFNASMPDARSVINKLKKKFPGQKFGVRDNQIHMDGKTIFDMTDSPLDYTAMASKVNDLLSEEGEAVSNINSPGDIARTPARIGKKKKKPPIMKKENVGNR